MSLNLTFYEQLIQPSGWSHSAGKVNEYSCWTIWLSIHFSFLDWAPPLCKQDKLAWGVIWIGIFPWTSETSRLQKSKLDLPEGEVSSFVPADATDWPWNNIVFVVLSQIQKVTEVDILESIMEMNDAVYSLWCLPCLLRHVKAAWLPSAWHAPRIACYAVGMSYRQGWERQFSGEQLCQPGLFGPLTTINQVFCFLRSLVGYYFSS